MELSEAVRIVREHSSKWSTLDALQFEVAWSSKWSTQQDVHDALEAVLAALDALQFEVAWLKENRGL